MLFSRYHQPKRANRRGGRKPSPATLAKRQAALRAQYEREQNAEAVAFEKFIAAEHGDFDGFAFVNLFHEHFDKRNAIYTTESDDEANAITPFGTFHAGADGVTAYFFSEQPKKVVYFNRSVYFI
jgi:hypothetical protein